MELEVYKKAEELHTRIKQLELAKKALQSLFKNEPFSVYLTTSVFNTKTVTPYLGVVSREESKMGFLHDTEDGQCILNAVNAQIQKLMKEFETLK